MTRTTIGENLQQYKSRFSLIAEQIMSFIWSTYAPCFFCFHLEHFCKFAAKFQADRITMFYVIGNSHSNREIRFQQIACAQLIELTVPYN